MSLIASEDMSIKNIFTNVSLARRMKNPREYKFNQTSDSWKSDSSTGYNDVTYRRKKTKSSRMLKSYYDQIVVRNGNTVSFHIITWLIFTFISIITTAKFKIVDKLTGFAFQLNHLDMAIMFATSQILYYGLFMEKGKLILPWLVTMFWALITTEGPCIFEASHKIVSTSLIGQTTFVGLILIFCM